MSCAMQHLNRSSKPECPFCRFDWTCFKNSDCRLPTNVDLLEVIENRCLFHDEITTLFCLQCKLRVCSSCIFIEHDHKNHKVIHLSDIPNAIAEAKQNLWNALDENRKYKILFKEMKFFCDQEKEMNLFDDEIKERLACLDNPTMDQCTLEALCESEKILQQQLENEQYFKFLQREISDFKNRLLLASRYPEFELSNNSPLYVVQRTSPPSQCF